MNPLSLQTDLSFLPLLFPAQISISLLNPLVFIIFILTCSTALRYLHIVTFGQEKTHNLGPHPFPSIVAPLDLSHDGTKPGGCGWGWNLAQLALDRSNERQERYMKDKKWQAMISAGRKMRETNYCSYRRLQNWNCMAQHWDWIHNPFWLLIYLCENCGFSGKKGILVFLRKKKELVISCCQVHNKHPSE